MVIAFCRKPLAGSLMISAKVLYSNHPEEATLPLRCLATATPLWTCRRGMIASSPSSTANANMLIANSQIHDKITKAKTKRRQIMKLLYKYYSNESKYAFENVENGNICFTSLESLNDPFEGIGRYLYDVSSEEQMYWDAIGSDLPALLAKRFSEDLRDMLNFKYRVFCSSKD